MKFKGKIFYCTNYDLGIGNNGLSNGHYVVVKESRGDKVVVRTITLLENHNGYIHRRINKVKSGKLLDIPMNETNLSKWSAINS